MPRSRRERCSASARSTSSRATTSPQANRSRASRSRCGASNTSAPTGTCTAASPAARPTKQPSSRSSRPRSARRSRKAKRWSSRCRGAHCATSTGRPARGARDSPPSLRRPRRSAGGRDARARPRLRGAARRCALRARDRAQLQHRHRRQPQLRVGRVRELRRDPQRSDLPPRARQHRHCDDRLAGAGRRAGDRRCAGVPRRVPRQAHRAFRPAAAVGGARLARRDRLDVDFRLHVQRDQLDPQGRRLAARVALLAGGSRARAGRDHHCAGVAHLPLRHRHRVGGARVTPAGRDGGGDRGRCGVLAAAVPGRAAAPAPRRRGRGPVRRRLHRDRFGRRLHPDGRRARQHHARSPHARLPARYPGRRPRPGRRHRRVSAPVPDRGRDRDAAAGSPHGGRDYVKRVALYAAALGFMAFAGFPFYWMLVTAFKQNRDLYVGAFDTRHVPWIFNDPPTLEHVRLLFGQTDFLRWIANTLIVVVAVVVVTVAVAVPAGYSLARLTGRWGERLGIGIFFTYLIPPTLLFIPFARLVALLGLQNSLGALILIYPTITIPFCTWLVMGFLRSVPWDIEEQAMIDGYSRLAVIVKVVPRLIVPGILTVVVFSFTLVLQEFVYALTFISSVDKMTVSLGVPIALVRGDVYHWGALMAAALFTSIPLAIVYNLFIDRFIQGLTFGESGDREVPATYGALARTDSR